MEININDNLIHLHRKRPGVDPTRSTVAARNPGLDDAVTEQLQDLVLDAADFANFLERLCGLSARLDSSQRRRDLQCSITLHRVHCAPTGAGSVPCAAALGELLGRHDEGPGKDALRTKATRVIHDAASEDRWPECDGQLLDAGIRTVMIVPLALDAGAEALLTFFSTDRDDFTELVASGAQRHASQARNALRLAGRLASSQQLAENLQKSMASRTAIDPATAKAMEQQRCTRDEAFEILEQAPPPACSPASPDETDDDSYTFSRGCNVAPL